MELQMQMFGIATGSHGRMAVMAKPKRKKAKAKKKKK